VEGKSRRGVLQPQLQVEPGGEEVKAGIDFDHREDAGIITETFGGGSYFRRIEGMTFNQ